MRTRACWGESSSVQRHYYPSHLLSLSPPKRPPPPSKPEPSIDEIGKMEFFSHLFSELVQDILDADTQLLAAVAMKGGGLIREIKQRPEVYLLEVTRHNRDRLPGKSFKRKDSRKLRFDMVLAEDVTLSRSNSKFLEWSLEME